MPSNTNMFIRIPKGIYEEYITDVINEMNMCKIFSVTIQPGKLYNTASIIVDYWYKGTKLLRDIMIRGDPIYIPNYSNDWKAYLLKPKNENTLKTKVTPTYVDEFGRDIPRKNIQNNINTVFSTSMVEPEFTDKLHPNVTNNRLERTRKFRNINEETAELFIRDCEMYFTPMKIHPEPDIVVPNAPLKNENSEPLSENIDAVVMCLEKIFTNDNNCENSISHDTNFNEAVSDITDTDFDETPLKGYNGFDFDAPKVVPMKVNYENMPSVKKRIIKLVKK
jgi:hypothetical protein